MKKVLNLLHLSVYKLSIQTPSDVLTFACAVYLQIPIKIKCSGQIDGLSCWDVQLVRLFLMVWIWRYLDIWRYWRYLTHIYANFWKGFRANIIPICWPSCFNKNPWYKESTQTSCLQERNHKGSFWPSAPAFEANQVMMHVIPEEGCWSEGEAWDQDGRRKQEKGHFIVLQVPAWR